MAIYLHYCIDAISFLMNKDVYLTAVAMRYCISVIPCEVKSRIIEMRRVSLSGKVVRRITEIWPNAIDTK